jgi:ubiquinone/menaquinone biosynthesis C-methylase UbiE
MDNRDHVLAFYDRHPISLEQILAGVKQRRGHLDALAPEDLFAFDQDHYGGLGVVDRLAERARIAPGSRVVDFCAGLGGPARYLAHRYGAVVTCIELNPRRAAGAAELTRRVGLAQRVRIVRGDVMCTALAGDSMDAVISQEALLHVPDKRAALAEAYRLLRHGGRLVFTDWAQHRPLQSADALALWRGIAAQSVQTFSTYQQLLRDVGFHHVGAEDLTADWAGILEERFAMYRDLREETIRLGTPSGDEAFYHSYARLVELVQQRILGGGRFAAEK